MIRRIALLFCLVVLAALPVQAGGPSPRLVAMVPMLPLSPGPHPDIEDLLQRHWRDYFEGTGAHAFTLAEVRAGRIDLDGDGEDELVLMIDRADWQSDEGKPLVVATWTERHWLPVGWGWGDEDQIFVTDEVIDGWHTLDAGKFLMRWTPKGYRRDPK